MTFHTTVMLYMLNLPNGSKYKIHVVHLYLLPVQNLQHDTAEKAQYMLSEIMTNPCKFLSML